MFSILSTSETSVSESYQNSLNFEVLKTRACHKPHLLRCGGSCFFDLGDFLLNLPGFEVYFYQYRDSACSPDRSNSLFYGGNFL